MRTHNVYFTSDQHFGHEIYHLYKYSYEETQIHSATTRMPDMFKTI